MPYISEADVTRWAAEYDEYIRFTTQHPDWYRYRIRMQMFMEQLPPHERVVNLEAAYAYAREAENEYMNDAVNTIRKMMKSYEDKPSNYGEEDDV